VKAIVDYRRRQETSMNFSDAAPSSLLYLSSAVSLVVASYVFLRNALGRDREYENLCPWWTRLLLYGVTCALVPPAGLLTGLGLYVVGRNRVLRKLGTGLVATSIIFLGFYLGIFFDPTFRVIQ
jgi:hypothetical protein